MVPTLRQWGRLLGARDQMRDAFAAVPDPPAAFLATLVAAADALPDTAAVRAFAPEVGEAFAIVLRAWGLTLDELDTWDRSPSGEWSRVVRRRRGSARRA